MKLALQEQQTNIFTRGLPERWRTHPFATKIARHISLSEDDLRSLWNLVESEVTIKKRKDVVVDGYEFRKLCFIEEGIAARYKLLRNGKRQIVNFLLPGDVIGLSGSFLGTARYSVVSVTDIKMQVCTLNAYVQLCYRQPQFGLTLSWLAVEESIMCSEHIINTGRRTPVERLAHFLLEIHSRLAMVGCASEDDFVLPISQEIISDALGLSVPHLNRTLAKLRSDGLISINGRELKFLDRAALAQLAHFQTLNLTSIPVAELANEQRRQRQG